MDFARLAAALGLIVGATVVAPARAFALRQEPALPTPKAPTAPPAAQSKLAYAFEKEREFDDFEAVAGTWSLSTGTLWCTSKGAREELRWRRSLAASGAISVDLVGIAHAGLSLRGGGTEVVLRVDRGAGRFTLDVDGKPMIERNFEATSAGPLKLKLDYALGDLLVRIQDDEPVRVTVPGLKEPLGRLALLSFKSQPRFDNLLVRRDEAPVLADTGDAGADGTALSEDLRIGIELAGKKLDAGEPAAALEELKRVLSVGSAGDAEPLPGALLTMLQRIAARDEKLRDREPLAARIAAATCEATDGSATLVLPFKPGFTARMPEVRRTDGPVFAIECAAPPLKIEVYRYDEKLKYWFGRDPRLVFCTGGGGPTLARARADEQRDLHEKAQFTIEMRKCRRGFDGEATYEYELAWPEPADGGATHALHEYFTLHRGHTWRFTIQGTALALALAEEDLEWLVGTFRFGKR